MTGGRDWKGRCLKPVFMGELLFLVMTRSGNGPVDLEGSSTNGPGCEEGHSVNISHQESRHKSAMLRGS